MFPVIMQHYSKEEIKKPSQVFSEYDFFFWLRIRIVQKKRKKNTKRNSRHLSKTFRHFLRLTVASNASHLVQ